MGIIAMKIFAQEKLISYSLSLPVTAVVVGMPQVEHIEQNVQIAKAFKPLPSSEMKSLSDQLSTAHKAAIDRFFADHVDA